MSCSRWAYRSSARAPLYVFRSANGRLLMKSKRLEMLCRKLSNVCTRVKARMPLLRQLEFAFRSTDILSVGQPGVSPGELVESAGKMPAGPTAETAVLLQTEDRKSTPLNSSHRCISYAVFCLKKKKTTK